MCCKRWFPWQHILWTPAAQVTSLSLTHTNWPWPSIWMGKRICCYQLKLGKKIPAFLMRCPKGKSSLSIYTGDSWEDTAPILPGRALLLCFQSRLQCCLPGCWGTLRTGSGPPPGDWAVEKSCKTWRIQVCILRTKQWHHICVHNILTHANTPSTTSHKYSHIPPSSITTHSSYIPTLHTHTPPPPHICTPPPTYTHPYM